MKHLLRRQVGTGFVIPDGFAGTFKLSHRGSDTIFELPLTVGANGSAETTWNVPSGAPMGDYDLSVEQAADYQRRVHAALVQDSVIGWLRFGRWYRAGRRGVSTKPLRE